MNPVSTWTAVAGVALFAACKNPEPTPTTGDPTGGSGTTSQPSTAAAVYDAAVGRPVVAAVPPNEQYAADGVASLVDGKMGSDDYQASEWMGWWYEDKPFEATIDLGRVIAIEELGVHTLTCSESWILYPRKVEFEVSDDGKSFRPAGAVAPTAADLQNGYPEAKVLKAGGLKASGRFVRVRAQRYGELPQDHPGYGGADGYKGEAWLFLDEILVNPKPR